MNPIKRVAGHVYFVYIAALFIATMLVVLLPVWISTLLPEPRRARFMHPLFKVWMDVYLNGIFCPVRRRNTHLFERGRSYVVVSNHNSFMDVPVTSPYIPGPNKTLAKAELARIPLFGVIYKAGSILVARKSEQSRRESFARMAEALDMGLHLCLYPEGTRNKTGEPIQPFYDGAFVTAIKAGAPVMPAVLTNTARILPRKPAMWAWPRPIRFEFLPPTETAGLSVEDAGGLKETVRAQMLEHYTTVVEPSKHPRP